MRTHRAIAVCVVVACGGAAGAGGAQESHEERIRRSREASNRAIAAHDLAGIERPWLDTIHIVTSTSAQATGRDPNRERMARQFTTRPDTIYVRTPVAIEVFEAWEVASERGEWVGRWTEPDGPVEIAGRYQAQWRRVNGEWRIQAELFVPTRCTGGAYCQRRPL